MACHADSKPDAEPDTVFEPVEDVAAEAGNDTGRRGVSLASHTGVGIAGAAGVLGAQRVLGSEDAPADGGQALDVFHPALESSADDQPRGISTNASPVAESAEQGSLPDSAEGVDPLDETAGFSLTSVESVEFLPPADERAHLSVPEDMAVGHEVADPGTMDVSEVAESVEPERDSSLASAETEIGGGISADFDGHDAHSAFGATSEIGMLDTEQLTAEDEDEDDLASTP